MSEPIPSNIVWTSPSMEYTYNGGTNTSQLGNYWSGYTGTDPDGNGIGEPPYVIGDGLGTDLKPLVAPFENYVDWDDGGGSGGSSELAYITVTPSDVELFTGNNCTFTAVALDGDFHRLDDIVFKWTSSNEAVGTVNSSGFFTSLSPGTTTIKAENGSISDTASVTVVDAAAELSPVSIELNETDPLVGVVYNLTVEIKNTGDIAAGEFNVAILRVPDDVEIANKTVAGIAAGQTLSLVIPSWSASAQASIGFKAIVDSGGTVPEKNELNNNIIKWYDVLDSIPEGVDLSVSVFKVNSYSNSVILHSPYNVYYIFIRNTANQPSGPFDISIRDSHTGITRVIAVGSLPGRTYDTPSSVTLKVPLNFSPDETGSFDAVLTIDPEERITEEIDRTNNQATGTFSITKNGYAGHRINGEEDIQTLCVWDINGSVAMSVGSSSYTSMGGRYSADTNYMNAAWNADDLDIPENAKVVEARLMLPYCWDLYGTFDGVYETITPKHVNMTFNGVDKTYDRFYTDRNGWSGYDVPYGQFAYDVTSEFIRDGTNNARFTVEDGTHQLCPRGMILMVVYEDKSLPRRQMFYAEGFDLLIGDAQYYTTPEMSTAYATFTGPDIDLENMTSAKLIAMATGPDGLGPNDARKNELFFNNLTVKNGWGKPLSPTEIAIATVDVTGAVKANGNEAGGRDYADYIEPMNFILIASYGEVENNYVKAADTDPFEGEEDPVWAGTDRGRLSYKDDTPTGEIKTSEEGKTLADFSVPSGDGKVSANIPKGTVTLDKDGAPVDQIEIESINPEDIDNSYDEGAFTFAGAAYECSPSGATFSPAIDLVFTFTADEWKQFDGMTPSVMYYNTKTKEWEEVETTYDPDTMTVTATVSHFSKYAVFAKTPGAAVTSVATEKSILSEKPEITGDKDPGSGNEGSSPVSNAVLGLFIVGAVGICSFGAYKFKLKHPEKEFFRGK